METKKDAESSGERSDREKLYDELTNIVRRFLEIIGEDPERDGLKNTPARVARMWLDELARGYSISPEEYVRTFNYEGDNGDDSLEIWNNIVIVYDIPVRSMCEHHLLPIIGTASIAYIPGNKILGFSKFARIVDAFSRRLQVQERLTNQIADFISNYLDTTGVMVIIEALHLCALHRGVREPLKMITRAARGIFGKDPDLRREVIEIISSRISAISILEKNRLL
ncbi:MAG: GTP cyclohydrolase I FolE [Desulfurococcales archaeon]|jgi:GTP cyclohydrolase I|nr:GTP cyclohydrolase I FolE [Desulfurococcales archaeon]